MDVILTVFVLFAIAVALGAVYLFRIAKNRVRQTAGSNVPNTRRALLAASVTAACIFVTTYWSAWEGCRSNIAAGRDEPLRMMGQAARFRYTLEEYAKEHGRYPDSLKDAFPTDTDFSALVDPWNNPYQYVRKGKDYRVFSLGRDGKPGGVGLDADFDVAVRSAIVPVTVPTTFYQFLFEGRQSGNLLVIALLGSVCGGLACLSLAGSPRGYSAISWPGFVVSILITTVAALFVVSGLAALYLIGNGH
jgi:hypothetical protein